MATDTRETLIAAGTELFLSIGYTGTGLNEILARAGVPKGSFYHHFGSKEAFGLAVVDRHAADATALTAAILGDGTQPPVSRVRRLFHTLLGDLDACDCCGGCLFGTLGQELANVSDPLRRRVAAVFRTWRDAIAATLEEARDRGELSSAAEPRALAGFLISAWEGAQQQMRIQRCADPLREFLAGLDVILPETTH